MGTQYILGKGKYLLKIISQKAFLSLYTLIFVIMLLQ